jgi:hypothetical protein
MSKISIRNITSKIHSPTGTLQLLKAKIGSKPKIHLSGGGPNCISIRVWHIPRPTIPPFADKITVPAKTFTQSPFRSLTTPIQNLTARTWYRAKLQLKSTMHGNRRRPSKPATATSTITLLSLPLPTLSMKTPIIKPQTDSLLFSLGNTKKGTKWGSKLRNLLRTLMRI